METTRNIGPRGRPGHRIDKPALPGHGPVLFLSGRAALRNIARRADSGGHARSCGGSRFGVKFEGIPSPSVPQDELESEYINSFDITPSCPLYEFHYRSGELTRRGNLGGASLLLWTFRRQAERHGKRLPGPPGGGLEFMAFLAMKEADAGRAGDGPDPYRRAQRDFLERHLGRWVDRLDGRIKKPPGERFYRGASFLLREFVKNHLLHLRGQGSAESIVPLDLGGDCAEGRRRHDENHKVGVGSIRFDSDGDGRGGDGPDPFKAGRGALQGPMFHLPRRRRKGGTAPLRSSFPPSRGISRPARSRFAQPQRLPQRIMTS